MKKYVITKSMDRVDCVNLVTKLYDELLKKEFFFKRLKKLVQRVKEKKRSKIRGNKVSEKIYATDAYSYKGIKMYFIMDEQHSIITIFNISPIDTPYVQYIVIRKDETPLVFTQHLLDRYNKRVLNQKISTHKELIVHLLLYNEIGNLIEYEDSNKVVEKIDGGFIFGNRYEDYVVLNTIYDSIEEKDDFFKRVARKTKDLMNTLSDSDRTELVKIYEQYLEDESKEEEVRSFLDKKGIDFN